MRMFGPDMFCKKGVIEDFAKFTGNTCAESISFNKIACLRQSLFFNKVAGLRLEKRNSGTGVIL